MGWRRRGGLVVKYGAQFPRSSNSKPELMGGSNWFDRHNIIRGAAALLKMRKWVDGPDGREAQWPEIEGLGQLIWRKGWLWRTPNGVISLTRNAAKAMLSATKGYVDEIKRS